MRLLVAAWLVLPGDPMCSTFRLAPKTQASRTRLEAARPAVFATFSGKPSIFAGHERALYPRASGSAYCKSRRVPRPPFLTLRALSSSLQVWSPTWVRRGLDGVRAARVACGPRHVCLSTVDGSLYTWGDNTFGALGHGDEQGAVTRPRVVAALQGETRVDRRTYALSPRRAA